MGQLKKDGRRLFQDLEGVLHADTQAEHEKMPQRLQAIVEKHRKLEHWNPPVDEEGDDKTEQETEQEFSLVRELEAQKNLLFRKNQIAVGQASQTKRECMQDFRRLTHENAELIAEMNRLRNERQSMERSYKEMEATIISLRGRGGVAKLGSGSPGAPTNGGGGTVARNASAPTLASNGTCGVMGGAGGASAAARQAASQAAKSGGSSDTPFIRRKQVDQEGKASLQRQRQQNQLPPVADRGGSQAIRTMAPMAKAGNEEVRF